MSNSNQAMVSVALSVALLGAVATMAYPLITSENTAATAPAAAPTAAANQSAAVAEAPSPAEVRPATQALATPQPEPSAHEKPTPVALAPQQKSATPSISANPAIHQAAAAPTVVHSGEPTVKLAVQPNAVPVPNAAPAPVRETYAEKRERMRAERAAAIKVAQEQRAAQQALAAARPVQPAPVRAIAPAPAPAPKKVLPPQSNDAAQWESIGAPAEQDSPGPRPAPQAVMKKEPVATPAQSAVRRDIPVTISGEKAWVQIEPTRTVTVRKGDILPNLGKVLEIRKTEVVTEHGTLFTN